MLSRIKKYIANAIIIILVVMAFLVFFKMYTENKVNKIKIQELEYVDKNNTLHNIQKDKKFSDLKNENKALYDSLKVYKKEINYLVQFKYEKHYDTGKIEVRNDTLPLPNLINEYKYSNSLNDTLTYELSVGSSVEPNWYRIKMGVKDKFTIVNKDLGNGYTETTIESMNKGNVSDVTLMKKPSKVKFFNRIAIGPSITYGYSLSEKKMTPTIGVSITYNIFATK